MNCRRPLSLLFGTLMTVMASAQESDSLYRETYRPQYHFTPAHRWIGDPCGLHKHNGRWMAYSWGGAASDDLVHWRELNDHAIKGVPRGISTFTGSVVVDADGTAGYGNDAVIALYTSFDENSKKQSQSMAFSLDGGETFQDYDLNPVLDIWSTEFRDPTVIRDPKSGRWIMLVAKALEKKVAIYGSDDLKHWEWLSDFGPLGDSERSWECPDMFLLPVDGNPDNLKWVMLLSINWAREQYFVGDFDGTHFVADPLPYPLYVDEGLDYYASRVFQDFDDPTGDVNTLGWVNTWDYAVPAPSKWGKGIWSIPRTSSLRTNPEGQIRLYQQPFEGLQQLRGKVINIDKNIRAGVTPLPAVSALANCYEMEVSIPADGQQPSGVYLCEGDGRRLTISYDPASRYLTVDRSNVTPEVIDKFERVAHVKVLPGTDPKQLKLHIFVDKSTVEIFVNDGEQTLSMLTFAAPAQTGVSLFTLDRSTHFDIKVWPLQSIWENQ